MRFFGDAQGSLGRPLLLATSPAGFEFVEVCAAPGAQVEDNRSPVIDTACSEHVGVCSSERLKNLQQ